MKFSLKLGKSNRTIPQLLKNNHGLNGPLSGWGDIQGSELYYGQAYEGKPTWKDYLDAGTDQQLPNLVNQGAAAVLFVPAGTRYLIYVFGYGSLSINDGITEWDFGLKVVLNSISPTGLKSVDSHTVSQKAKNKRVQLATQAGIGEFEVDILQDLVSQVSGRSVDPTFAKSLTGGETLTIIADMEGTSIARKSIEIMRRYGLTTYQANFKWIDFISSIKDPTIIDTLDQMMRDNLSDLISGNGNHEFVLSYPSIINVENLDFITFSGLNSDNEFDVVDITDFISEYLPSGRALPINDLNGLFINLHDGNGKIFKHFPFIKCLTTEVKYGNSFYILASGTWFKLDDGHYNAVSNFFNQLLQNPNEFVSGERTIETNEPDYLTQPLPAGSELFDRRNYNLHGIRNAIEIADIVTNQTEMIHVKDGGSAAKLSHLFNQGTVSARLLLTDKKFRADFRGKITDANIRRLFPLAGINPGNTTVVFKILKKGPIFTISFFTKIILYDTYQKIKAMGYNFRLEWVEYI